MSLSRSALDSVARVLGALCQHFPVLAGPHPRSLSLGGRPSAGYPPAGQPNAGAALGTPARSGRRRFRLITALLCLITISGCRQDMHNQPKYRPLRATTFFADGSSARPLVEGTVARGTLQEDPAFFTGKVGNAPVKELPFPVDESVLNRGQDRFNVFCAPCHDATGSGRGMVVQRGYRQPPSLHDERLRNAEAGHFFDVMTNGFGAMPDYRTQLPARDRWAVVAYIRALQLSQHASAADVPGGDPTKVQKPADETRGPVKH